MKKRLAKLLFSLLLIAGICFTAAALSVRAENRDTVLVFTSDVHHTTGENDGSAKRLENFLKHVTKEYGTIDAVGICGDLAAIYKGDTYWSHAAVVMNNVEALGIEGIYTTGNHEHKNGSFSTSGNSTVKRYTRLGLGKAANNYEIYCMGAASQTEAFPESDIKALSDYLKSVGTEKPVFILSHYPLHSYTYKEGGTTVTRDPENRKKVIELLNQYPNTFFIWGHNHSKDDVNYDRIQTESIGDIPISFTYLAGGSMTEYADGNNYAGSIKGKGLVVTVSEDGTIVSLCYLDTAYGIVASWTNALNTPADIVLSSRIEGGTESVALLSGGGEYNSTRKVKICAQNDLKGFEFVGWFTGYSAVSNGNLYSTNAELLIDPQSIHLTAVYRPKKITFRVTFCAESYSLSGTEGTLNGTKTIEYPSGSVITIRYLNPPKGFACWKDGAGNVLGQQRELTFIVTGDRSVTAVTGAAGDS